MAAVKGFAFTALVLIGLDVALQAPASRLTALLEWPTQWLAGWMDPAKPLIGPGKLTGAAAPTPPKQEAGGGLGVFGYVPKALGF